MKKHISHNSSQIFASLGLIILVSLISYLMSPLIGYRVVALILLVTVSVIAMSFDIIPTLASAFSSALIWDFFFIPPHFTLQVNNTEDLIMLVMYFLIASVSAVLTFKIRQAEKKGIENEEKEHTLKLYNTLLNSLSHELRTPIATIVGATDTLQSGNANLTPLHRNELIGEISNASLRLNQQVENLLNMSRLESGFIQPKNDWCDITEIIYDVVKVIEQKKISQKIHISIDPGLPLFKLDPGMMAQILYNLVNNAVSYTPENTNIFITAACHADMLEVIIEDEGKGFPADEIPFVFNKFYRLKNTEPGGTGLGLSIVKGFAEAMKGNITLESTHGSGARFTLTVPAETNYLKYLKNE